ncbi:hypothetical protein [Magnetococcus sp. PR-3]|uniref:hypothetical protein n=1 Tax=Magnetococcus sp. PR-3 TaxID=3120355 RepID=UPI002FCE2268
MSYDFDVSDASATQQISFDLTKDGVREKLNLWHKACRPESADHAMPQKIFDIYKEQVTDIENGSGSTFIVISETISGTGLLGTVAGFLKARASDPVSATTEADAEAAESEASAVAEADATAGIEGSEAEIAVGMAAGEDAAAATAAASATTVAIAALGVTAVVFGALAPLMFKDEQQQHFIINDSDYNFLFSPFTDLYNHHGKTVLMPATEEAGTIAIPARTAETVYANIFGFQKNDSALFGAAGAYKLTNALNTNVETPTEHDLKIYYYQPENGHNGVAISVNDGSNLEQYWSKYDDQDSLQVDFTGNHKIRVRAIVNDASGGAGKVLIYIMNASEDAAGDNV